ncbi:MAG: glycosyltransferase family 4 protein [Streptomyces sp.]|nr:glycosyltransferase family 4 protein [Streptomyces sp.]
MRDEAAEPHAVGHCGATPLGPRRVAVLFPALLGGGGAEYVCAWILQALAGVHDVTLVTLTPVDLGDLDRSYGTTIGNGAISLRPTLPRVTGPLFERCFGRYSRLTTGLRQHLLIRGFKAIRHEYDICFSAYNEMDFGTAGIQYLHDRPRSRAGGTLLKLLSGYDERRVLENVSLAPSYWLKHRYDSAYPGLSSTVVYPPVRTLSPGKPWAEREDAFVCVARLSAEKNVHEAISIVAGVRSRGFDVCLRIVSGGGRWPYDSRIRRLVRKNADWITLHTDLSDGQYRAILRAGKFGVSACPAEGFGIATAELIDAGRIPFVRKGAGGQAEIVHLNDSITFESVSEAVAKVVRILHRPTAQCGIVAELADRKSRFSTDRFISDIRRLVDDLAAVTVRHGDEAS